ncbi:MAG: endonuclease I [Bacteroidetes bacterium]|nr:MAG: endonuclease I [Bacteroidota bacterium]
MKNITLAIVWCCLMTCTRGLAQFHQSVFPTLSGQELLDKLVETYKPVLNLTQGMARDTLFAKIDNHNDSLTCVYTGFTIYLNPNDDPTQAAFDQGINTEHSYPQSMGATGQARGDMHHLYPTRADVNAARGNLPFAEIEDTQTQTWYYLDQAQSDIPTEHIDLYSEWTPDAFEVPEAQKGNIARSMFYFYTMYKDQADAANANFFPTQRTTLCAWHLLDPVDEDEWNRTFRIAEYQDGKPNPFVLDCTLPERTFCQDLGAQCDPVSTGEVSPSPAFQLFQNEPNPFRTTTKIKYELARNSTVELWVIHPLSGERMLIWKGKKLAGPHEFQWTPPASFSEGVFFYQLIVSDEKGDKIATRKMIFLK